MTTLTRQPLTSVSVSAMKTDASCPKRNYFERILRIGRLPKGHFAFGTVLHAVAERWLLANDKGYTEAGDIVNIYPKGWDTGISPAEAHQIRELIALGIENGHIVRTPGRLIETQIGQNPRTGEGTPFEVIEGVGLFGFIDVELHYEIVDFKTTKNMKYALSPKKLSQDTQMLAYGYYKLEKLRRAGEVLPRAIYLTHVVFSKDPGNKVTRRTTAACKLPCCEGLDEGVSPRHLDEAWVDIQLAARRLAKHAAIEEWHDVPGPAENSNACHAYGQPCDYIKICGGMETPETFQKRVKALLTPAQKTSKEKKDSGSKPPASATNPNPTTTPGDKTMSLAKFRKIAQSNGAAAPAAATLEQPAPQAQPAPEAPVAEAPAEEAAPAIEAAPWFVAGCKACSTSPHPGFNTRLSPCRICDGVQRKAGGVTSSEYIVVIADGVPMWDLVGEAPAPVAEAPAPTPVAETPAPTPALVTRPELVAAGEEHADNVKAIKDIVEGPKSAGRKARDGFVLFVGCTPTKTWRDVVSLNDIFSRLGEAIALEKSQPSYWSMDTWKRRDMLRLAAPELLDALKRKAVVVTGNDPDVAALVSALHPLAEEVVGGLTS